MTLEDRNTILEAADILKTLGGNNGFANLQPKLKTMLKSYGGKLQNIVERDILEADGEIAPGVKIQQVKSRQDLELATTP